ncbi:amidohydrolase family protein [Natronosalvus rutilus]|uniref:Amidohydrolase family protein n=1 Tax=Natronosalvus rutilus TaxID=2953753 RepID=A0A9E7NEY5_9EURY|nr:amidohydrolase family protein [Natronosalvus rutilus]UTF55759.1 amidohydrolase family protein [Natronosalvus rutilus]
MSQEQVDESTANSQMIIDCDLHQSYRSPDEISRYLPKRYDYRGVRIPTLTYGNPAGFGREDALPDDTDDFEYAGSEYSKFKENHLDRYGIDYALLTGHAHFNINALPNRDYAVELARAHNKWLINDWLPKDDRFRGSLHVAMQDPEATAAMIREQGTHPDIVQILIQGGSTQVPLGDPQYWPVYEAAAELDLPVALHVSSEGEANTGSPTGAGFPNTYLEWHTTFPAVFMGQLASIIAEGVFEEFTDLKFVFTECGYTWVPFFMWRMDEEWRATRAQVPWLEQAPSEYIREHVRFTTQPVHAPERPHQFKQILEMMHADETLMFASDYPHWDSDSPEHALPNLPDDLTDRIYYENAAELYGLSA